MKIMVIGGGASGMMAAFTASQVPENEVLMLERQARVGRKLLASGNGRCNLTNRELSAENYHGQDRSFCRYALEEFGVEDTLRFFRTLGLITTTQSDGRVYPHSDSANSVVDVLRLHLQHRKNVDMRTSCEIEQLGKADGKFCATVREELLLADRVIVCTGGVAGGKLGGTDFGYRLLGALGHTRTKLYPALVQLRTDPTYVGALKGVRCDAQVLLMNGAKPVAQSCGEIQFTQYGVSGPAVFEVSREAGVCAQEIVLDFLRQVPEHELLQMLYERRAALPECKAEDFLTGMLHNRLGRTILRSCGCSLEQPCKSLCDTMLSQICRQVKHFSIPVLSAMGMNDAQVTAGGIKTAEFSAQTMESRLCEGLYAAGEVLDVDGDCGGYNLQWAWSSGHLAGQCK